MFRKERKGRELIGISNRDPVVNVYVDIESIVLFSKEPFFFEVNRS